MHRLERKLAQSAHFPTMYCLKPSCAGEEILIQNDGGRYLLKKPSFDVKVESSVLVNSPEGADIACPNGWEHFLTGDARTDIFFTEAELQPVSFSSTPLICDHKANVVPISRCTWRGKCDIIDMEKDTLWKEAKVTIEREDAPFDLLRSRPCLEVVTHQHPQILHFGHI